MRQIVKRGLIMNFVDFYLGKAADHLGRMLEDIWRWNDDKLEARHDFIQVLFPLTEPSEHIPSAPVLDAAALAEFQRNPIIQNNLLRSFQRMLKFYGFEEQGSAIVPAANFPAKSSNWLFPGDHNYLRITRILKCLSASGLQDQARAFVNALLPVATPDKVAAETIRYWKAAAEM
jgi:hypothetical protein